MRSDEVVQIPDQRTVGGEDIIRTDGKATYYLSLRDGINFGLKKHFKMISSCIPRVLNSANFLKSAAQRTVGSKNRRNIE